MFLFKPLDDYYNFCILPGKININIRMIVSSKLHKYFFLHKFAKVSTRKNPDKQFFPLVSLSAFDMIAVATTSVCF